MFTALWYVGGRMSRREHRQAVRLAGWLKDVGCTAQCALHHRHSPHIHTHTVGESSMKSSKTGGSQPRRGGLPLH